MSKLTHVTILALLFLMALTLHVDRQVFIDGRKNKESTSHGSYSSIFTLGSQPLGSVLEIIMRSCHLMRSKVVYQNH